MIRTRFAPSPTGYLHIGGARTALFNWLFAKNQGGRFVLRIEDTDTERSTKEAIEQILDAMNWLGLEADEGPFFQMQRLDHYQRVAQHLLDSDNAYRCYCTREELAAMREDQKARGLKPRYDGRCRERTKQSIDTPPVIRFKNPRHGQVVVFDRVRGKVVFDNAELDDLVILRSDGVPTYNFSVVVDDNEMAITHVIRGDDHLNNTPRQLNLMAALNFTAPEYAHVPMILGPDGSRLSKRHGSVSVLAYREAGYLSDAILSYIVRLGWSHGDQELFTLGEMVEHFDLAQVSESAASFDPEKLLWVNQQWLKCESAQQLEDLLEVFLKARGFDTSNGPVLSDLVEVQRNRARTLAEMVEKSAFIYEDLKEYEPRAAQQNLGADALPILQSLESALSELDEWTVEATQGVVHTVAERLDFKIGKVAQPLRVAVTGDSASPGIGETLFLLGPTKTRVRLRKAIEYVSGGIDD